MACRDGVQSLDAVVETDRWVAVLDQSTAKESREARLLDRLEAAFVDLDHSRLLSRIEFAEALSEALGNGGRGNPCVTIVAVDALQRRVVRIGDGHAVIGAWCTEGIILLTNCSVRCAALHSSWTCGRGCPTVQLVQA